ncbi:MAG: DUF1236 domain-containing protein [Rhizobiales bacterium]|nr:DUF1236 domain-containing protein [Hyphomicrobiales bacterium]
MRRIAHLTALLAIMLTTASHAHAQPHFAQARDNATTGQGAAGMQGGLTADQRGRIVDIIKKQGFREATDIKFPLSVGAAVPLNENLFPLPASVAEIRPEWRDYHYLVVSGKVVIVDPRELKVKAVIEH